MLVKAAHAYFGRMIFQLKDLPCLLFLGSDCKKCHESCVPLFLISLELSVKLNYISQIVTFKDVGYIIIFILEIV